MINGLVSSTNVSFLFVFLEGILSFFSPCVIPLIPVYMGYLAGSGKWTDENGVITYKRKTVFIHTLFFVLGISLVFFILGMSFTVLGSFFKDYKTLFTRIGGVLIVMLGLFQLGFLDFSFLQKERKIKIDFMDKEMNPFVALLMGFTFSFAWTPCIGPMLSSVLIMASGAATAGTGNLLVLVYSLGFLIPFLLLGIFTSEILNFLKSKQKLLKYTIKAGAIILIIMGVMTFTGWMNGVSGYLNSISSQPDNNTEAQADVESVQEVTEDQADTENLDNDTTDSDTTDSDTTDSDTTGSDTTDSNTTETDTTDNSANESLAAFDFTLTDQYGNTHTLSEYKGKVVFLNFWATWCPPCKEEMPDIQALYEEYNLNEDEVVFIGVANPSSDEYPNNQDSSKEEVIAFLEDNGYTFPVVMDETGEVLENYMISAFPTTFMIDKEGNVVGYVPGMMTKDIMISIINQTIEATE